MIAGLDPFGVAQVNSSIIVFALRVNRAQSPSHDPGAQYWRTEADPIRIAYRTSSRLNLEHAANAQVHDVVRNVQMIVQPLGMTSEHAQ